MGTAEHVFFPAIPGLKMTAGEIEPPKTWNVLYRSLRSISNKYCGKFENNNAIKLTRPFAIRVYKIQNQTFSVKKHKL